jgi:hypothetical protein
MAGLVEMNSFIGKFVNLWQSGSDASLKIESSAGKASVVLQLELGSPFPQGHPLAAHHTGNARSRRRERRAEARKVASGNVENDDVTAQETGKAVEAEHVNDKDLNDADKALVEGAIEVEDFVHETKKKDENNDDSVSYEMQFDAPNCSDNEIEECFDFNLKDELKGKQLEKDDTEYSFKEKDTKLVLRKDSEHYKALKTFIVKFFC